MENPGTEPLPPHPPPMMPATTTAAQNVTYVVYQMAAPTAAVQPKMDWSSCCSFYFARTMLTFFLWASWVVYIAGASKNQQICQGGGMFNAAGQINAPFPDVVALNEIAVNNVPNDASSCVYYFSLLWWSIWLQFTTVLMVTATTFQIFARFPGVKGIFTITLYFAIMSSVLMFVQANIYNNATYVNINKVAFPNNDWTISCTLCLVGTITSLILNFIYLIWNSWTDVPKVAGIPTAMPTPTVNAHIAPEAAKATAV